MEIWVRIEKTEQGYRGSWPDALVEVEGSTYPQTREQLEREVLETVAKTWGNLQPPPEGNKGKGKGWEVLVIPQRALLAMTIKRARLGKGLSQSRVARRLDVPDTTYRRWEDPFTFNPTLDTLERIADVLGVHLVVNLGADLDPAKYGTWEELKAKRQGLG